MYMYRLSKQGTVLRQVILHVTLMQVICPSLSAYALCRSLWTCKSGSLPQKAALLLAWSTAQGIFHLEYLCSGAMNKSSHTYLPFELESASPRAHLGVDFGNDLLLFGFLRSGPPRQNGKGTQLHPTRRPVGSSCRALGTCDSQSSRRMDLSFTCSSISCVQIFSFELSKMNFRIASSTVTMDSLLSMMNVAKC